jgi:hypothetical protein
MTTWRVTYKTHTVHVEAQYAVGAFSAARPLLVQQSGESGIAFVDCEFVEMKAEPDPKFGRVA